MRSLGPDHVRARLAGRAAARRGRTRRRTTAIVTVAPAELRVGDIVVVRPGGRVPADGGSSTGSAEHGRVDGHRRVAAGAPRRRATTSWPAPSPPTPACASGSPPSATTPRWPASSGSSPTRRTSTSRAQRLADRAAGWLFWFALGAGGHHRVVWTLLGDARRGRDRAPSPCWSSPARTPSGWRSRSWSPSPPSARPAAACWSRTGSPWRACAPSTPCCSTRPAR